MVKQCKNDSQLFGLQHRGAKALLHIKAFALAGQMNHIGHNTTGRCPGLCAFGLSGRLSGKCG